jgi:prefoldin subunit 2
MSSASVAQTAPSGKKIQVTEQELAQIYQGKRSELQSIAAKIAELEGESDEHK